MAKFSPVYHVTIYTLRLFLEAKYGAKVFPLVTSGRQSTSDICHWPRFQLEFMAFAWSLDLQGQVMVSHILLQSRTRELKARDLIWECLFLIQSPNNAYNQPNLLNIRWILWSATYSNPLGHFPVWIPVTEENVTWRICRKVFNPVNEAYFAEPLDL
jgi:hypothetical protein